VARSRPSKIRTRRTRCSRNAQSWAMSDCHHWATAVAIASPASHPIAVRRSEAGMPAIAEPTSQAPSAAEMIARPE
jgi:hypothetical protein